MPEYIHHGSCAPLDGYRVANIVQDMAMAYLTCAAWSSSNFDAEGHEIDTDLAKYDFSTQSQIVAFWHCSEFLHHPAAQQALATGHWSPDQLGHDLWLTRNRHGVGFWDRYSKWGEDHEAYDLGEVLTSVAHDMGEQYAYVGDDNMIHFE